MVDSDFWNFLKSSKVNMHFDFLKKSNLKYEPHFQNGEYKSVKFSNVENGTYRYFLVFYFYKNRLTHIQIYSSSNNKNEDLALKYLLNLLDGDLLWGKYQIIEDKKNAYKYISIE